MTHYAGYCPRFHPSDFEVRTRDGVGEDWPISYRELKRHFERSSSSCRSSGDYWPWGDPHRYPHTAHPVAGGAELAWAGARQLGIEMRVGPVGITNGSFGNRPHCIYRGFCLQGCKVNAKASPLVTHIPDAIEHGAEVRADCMVTRIEVDDSSGRVTGVRYVSGDQERFQRADAVAVAGYSIETPRLLLNSSSQALPARPGNDSRPGRPLRDGAGRAAGRRTASRRRCGCTRRRRPRSPPSSSTRRTSRGVRARLLDPDGRAAADRLGGARAGRRPLGPGAAGIHARLQPLVHAGRPLRAAAAAGESRHGRHRRAQTRTASPSRGWTTASATTTARTSPTPSARCARSWRRPAPRTS